MTQGISPGGYPLYTYSQSNSSTSCMYDLYSLPPRPLSHSYLSGLLFPAHLLSACQDGDLLQVKRILERAPHLLQTRDETNDMTPLHVAARWGHLPVVQYLVEIGADVTAKDKAGMTPSHLALKRFHPSIYLYLEREEGLLSIERPGIIGSGLVPDMVR